jgi:hypothetical protein
VGLSFYSFFFPLRKLTAYRQGSFSLNSNKDALQMLSVVGDAAITAVQEAEVGRSWSEVGPGKKYEILPEK